MRRGGLFGKDEQARRRQLLNDVTQLVTRRDSVKPGSLFFSASISLHTTKPRGGCRFLYSFCVVNDRQ